MQEFGKGGGGGAQRKEKKCNRCVHSAGLAYTGQGMKLVHVRWTLTMPKGMQSRDAKYLHGTCFDVMDETAWCAACSCCYLIHKGSGTLTAV